MKTKIRATATTSVHRPPPAALAVLAGVETRP